MATEDDLKRGGQAAVALMGIAAARARQIAEQLLGSRSHPGPRQPEPKSKAETLVEEGKHAAAEVIGALRREAGIMIHDLERLEQALRGQSEPDKAPTPDKAAPVKRSAPAKKAASAKRAPAAKKSPRPSKSTGRG